MKQFDPRRRLYLNEEAVCKLALTQEQLEVVQTAMEEYFRLRIGQFGDLANSLTVGKLPPNSPEEQFNDAITRRNDSAPMFDSAFRVAIGKRYLDSELEIGKTALVAHDIWQAIRYARFLRKPESEKNYISVESDPPLCKSDLPLCSIEWLEVKK